MNIKILENMTEQKRKNKLSFVPLYQLEDLYEEAVNKQKQFPKTKELIEKIIQERKKLQQKYEEKLNEQQIEEFAELFKEKFIPKIQELKEATKKMKQQMEIEK